MGLPALLERELAATGVVGAALAVYADGEIEVACAGLADREAAERVSAATRFQIASVTKPMVATVVAKLAAEHRLDLADCVAVHVPELRAASWGERVTVLDLMTNRSGVPLSAEVEFNFKAEGEDALARIAAAVAEQPLAFEPRTRWSYSNVAWCLLGRAIETVCGCRWEEAMRLQLFEPLRMTQTSFISEATVPHAAACYEQPHGELERVDPWRDRALGPAGSTVWSTVTDLIGFARLHLDDGQLPDGSRFAPPGVLGGLRRLEMRLSLPDFMDGWSRGWAQWDWPGGPLFGWDGVAAGHRAILKFAPARAGAMAFTANSSRGRELYRRVFPPILTRRFDVAMRPFDRTPATTPTIDLQRYEGQYAWPDASFDVRVRGDHLEVTSSERIGTAVSERTATAVPIDKRVFLFDPDNPDFPVIVFHDFDERGFPQTLYYAVWAYPRQG